MSMFPYMSYQTNYPNEVHQLNVSLSKHLYVLKNGEIKYQKKPFDLNLNNFQKSDKFHIVHYVVRDHFSNAFYGEIYVTNDLSDLRGFLFRAWSKKEEYPFCGIPENLIVLKTVQKFSPGILEFIENCGVSIVNATSGFQAGVRTLKTWEEELRFATSLDGDFKNIEGAQKNIIYLCAHVNSRDFGKKESNISRWHKNIQRIKLPVQRNT